ncbi:hypothetical protein IQ235_07790 [Oscillatoriales cyanobacterium LEGE 11467]|uniref:Uncharacterized protein n=1 Tax=Zarconia navalis LEGE 11467 TaxID=1828826 RepID=A0A928VZT4_9CYAN|nr:DUF3114 domain-containing protein [Zarconia navalis]MBE9040680.1 hypothetical protein [Zarconia navalis LEGE 11467]
MVKINEEDYPIVSVKFENTATIEETQQYLDRFSNWLSRDHLFGLILHQPQATPDNPEEIERAKKSHQLVVTWAKPNKPKIARYCVGIAVVVDLSQMSKHKQKIAPKALKVLFGCSGQIFGDRANAEQWIHRTLNKSMEEE